MKKKNDLREVVEWACFIGIPSLALLSVIFNAPLLFLGCLVLLAAGIWAVPWFDGKNLPALCALCVLCGSALSSLAQPPGTTYVVPRPYTLFSITTTNQSFTNGVSANTNTASGSIVLTNWLNAAAFHRIQLFASMNWTNPAGILNSNCVISLDFSPGTANGYTNPVVGSNIVWTTSQPFAWTFQMTSNSVFMTNLDYPWADGIPQIKVTKVNFNTTNPATGWTNNLQFQLDATLTP